MPTEQRKKVLIGVPSWGVSPPECMDYRNAFWKHLGWWEAQKDCPYLFDMVSVSDIVVQLARDQMARATVEGGYDYLGMIDDDMMMDGYDMWDKLLARDVPLVAPLAFMRSGDHSPVIFVVRGGFIPGQPGIETHTQPVLNYPKNALVACDAVGFGAVLIKAEVLRAIEPPWFMSSYGDPKYGTGEDVLFCTKVTRAGFKVYSDTSICLKHLAPREYIDEAYYERTNPNVEKIRRITGDWTREKADANLPI